MTQKTAQEIYSQRFSSLEDALRELVWEVLLSEKLQKYVAKDARVLDLGAGDSFFLRHVVAAKKIAVDINEKVKALREFGIDTLCLPSTAFASALDEPVDVIFCSNFFEHLSSKQEMLETLAECHKALLPGGKLIVLQPNIRYVGVRYWDYIDHNIALTDKSLEEALKVSGFIIDELLPRFLPYTVKSRLGQSLLYLGTHKWGHQLLFHGRGRFGLRQLIRFYCRSPWLWRIFGAQTLAICHKSL